MNLHFFFTLFFLLQASFSWTNEKQKILVTGGTGYIGSQTCKLLDQAGYYPIVYDNLQNGFAEAVRWGVLEVGDISDRDRLNEVIAKHHPIAVIHFAALKAAGDSIKDPSQYYQTNVTGSLILLDVLLENKINNFIFSSSAAIYGMPSMMTQIKEDFPPNPINPYGQSKLMTEKILADFHNAYGLNYVALRYFNAAGADLDLECGENSKIPKNLIPIVMQVAMGERKSLEIFGTDYPTPDGSAIRDYIHVVDLADAHIKALNYLLAGGNSCSLNLGTGFGASVKEVLEIAREITGKAIPAVETPRRAGDPAYLVADSSLAKEVLDWEPKHSDLRTIIKTEWQWRTR